MKDTSNDDKLIHDIHEREKSIRNITRTSGQALPKKQLEYYLLKNARIASPEKKVEKVTNRSYRSELALPHLPTASMTFYGGSTSQRTPGQVFLSKTNRDFSQGEDLNGDNYLSIQHHDPSSDHKKVRNSHTQMKGRIEKMANSSRFYGSESKGNAFDSKTVADFQINLNRQIVYQALEKERLLTIEERKAKEFNNISFFRTEKSSEQKKIGYQRNPPLNTTSKIMIRKKSAVSSENLAEIENQNTLVTEFMVEDPKKKAKNSEKSPNSSFTNQKNPLLNLDFSFSDLKDIPVDYITHPNGIPEVDCPNPASRHLQD